MSEERDILRKTNSGGMGVDDQQAIWWRGKTVLWKAIYWLAANATCLAGDLLHNNFASVVYLNKGKVLACDTWESQRIAV